MKYLSSIIITVLLVLSCSKKVAITTPLVGREKVILRPVILANCHDGDVPRVLSGTQFNMHAPLEGDKVEGGSSYLKAGDKIVVKGVYRYVTDERGEWVGVVGEVSGSHDLAGKSFVYCWSQGGLLKEAPWESENMDKKRSWKNIDFSKIN